MLGVTGLRSAIVEALALLRPDEEIVRLPAVDHGYWIQLKPDEKLEVATQRIPQRIPQCHRYLFCAGFLPGKGILLQSRADRVMAAEVNMLDPIRYCEAILDGQPDARICVVGSQSAVYGSHDWAYAASKAGLHAYVKARAVKPTQQLFCISPGIIRDCGMTLRRPDFQQIITKRPTVTAKEVAESIVRHLYRPDPERCCNVVVHIDKFGEGETFSRESKRPAADDPPPLPPPTDSNGLVKKGI